MTVGSLFAGIGGFDLGFERAGFEIKWQVEIDPFCRKVLEKHWPHVRRYEDVRTVGAELEPVDVICGGFPCQDISVAGRGAGIDGSRSGLWSEYARLIRELRPRYVVVENVSALLARGLGRILGDLAESGYDAEWDCIPASAVGAPHRRDRVWLVAYSVRAGRREDTGGASGDEGADGWRPSQDDHQSQCNGQGSRAADMADAQSGIRQRTTSRQTGHVAFGSQDMADTGCNRLEGAVQAADGERSGARVFQGRAIAGRSLQARAEQWIAEPNVGRVAHGVPARVDRLRGLGNSIVPQIAQWIAERIKEAEGLA